MCSDHSPISLKLTYSHSHAVKDNTFRQPLRKKAPSHNKFTNLLWKTDSKTKFINALSSPSVQEQIDSFSSEHYTSVDDEVSHFNQIINTVAKSCLVPSRKSSIKHKKKSKPWYDHTCKQLKKQLHQVVKKINPTSLSLRQEYFALKKKYNRHVKMIQKRYKTEIVNKINALSTNRSQELWKHINRLRKTNTVEEETFVSPEDWISHYQQLLHDNQESHATLDFFK